MSNFTNLSVMLVAAGLVSASLPARAQASELDDLKAKVQKLDAEVTQLQQQKPAAAQPAAPAPPQNSFLVNGALVTFYGDIDLYANHMTSSSGHTINAFEDGAFLRSRWGFRGLKDVGDGYAMKFCVEGGINGLTGQGADLATTSGTTYYGGRLFDRQAWVGLLTPVGEFRIGRQNTTIFFNGSLIDFGERTLGSPINYFGVPSRCDADVSYISPRKAGFLLEAHYSFAGSNINGGFSNQHIYQYSLDYKKGPVDVGYMAMVGAPPTYPTAPATSIKYANTVVYDNLYAKADYGHGNVWVVFIRSNNNGVSGALFNGGSPMGNVGITATGTLVTGTVADVNTYYNIWQLSADYRVTSKLRVGGIWGKIHDTSGSGKDNTGGDFGFYYNIWKDTLLYGLWDVVKNSPNAGFRQAASAALPTNFSAAADVNGQTITGVQLGFVYRF